MIRRQIQKSDLVSDQHSTWNAFVDLLAVEDYEQLTEVQRSAHLVFWYDAEVQNGGHLQYFSNSAGQRAVEAVAALSALKMNCQKAVLSDAVSFVAENPISEIDTAEEYVAEALEDRFDHLDSRYYSCEPSTTDALEEYLRVNLDEFIELV